MAFDDGIKTVSGSIAHTDDAAAKVPFVSVKCWIKPTLSGVSSVTETQTGRNLLDVPAREELTRNGVISSVASDGTITASGQSTGNGDIPITLETSVNLIGGQTYTFSINGTDTRTGSVYVYFAGGSYISINNANHSGTYTPSADQTITGVTLRMFNGQSITLSAKIMLEIGSTAHDYEPYTAPTQYTASLGRTIYGGTADIVNGEGEITHGLYTFTGNEVYVQQTNQVAVKVSFTVGSSYQTGLDTAMSAVEDFVAVGCGASSYLYVKTTMTAEDLKTYMANHTVLFVYVLATPTDFTFTPITPTPETVGNVNNVYCNTGDTELTYHDNAHGFAEVTVNKAQSKNFFPFDKYQSFLRFKQFKFRIPKGSYTFSWDLISTTAETLPAYMQISFACEDGTTVYNPLTTVLGKMSKSFTLAKNVTSIIIYSGTTYATSAGITATIDNIQLELGSQATSYEPYVAPISKTAYLHKVIYGGKTDVVKGTCEPKNLLKLYLARTSNLGVNFSLTDDGLLHMEGTNTSSTGSAFSGGNYNTYDACPWKFPAGTYTASSLITADNDKVGSVNLLIRTKTDNTQYSYYLKDSSKTFTVNEDFGAWFWASVLKTKTVNCDIGVQLEKASSATDFAPYFEPFSFPPIGMETDEGENTLFANEGASAITYRKETD